MTCCVACVKHIWLQLTQHEWRTDVGILTRTGSVSGLLERLDACADEPGDALRVEGQVGEQPTCRGAFGGAPGMAVRALTLAALCTADGISLGALRTIPDAGSTDDTM